MVTVYLHTPWQATAATKSQTDSESFDAILVTAVVSITLAFMATLASRPDDFVFHVVIDKVPIYVFRNDLGDCNVCIQLVHST